MTLIATGLLNQEMRLQAVEKKLQEMSSTAHEPTSQGFSYFGRMTASDTRGPAFAPTNEVGRAQVRDRERMWETGRAQDVHEGLNTDTRLKYLEQDVKDNYHETGVKLKVVEDRSIENLRVESRDIRELHSELNTSVHMLKVDIKSSFDKVESDIEMTNMRIDIIEKETELNTERYYSLNNGIYYAIDFIMEIDYYLEERVYMLEKKMDLVLESLEKITELLKGEEDKEPQPGEPKGPEEPEVVPIGTTGGVQSSSRKTMDDAEKALQEWMERDKALRAKQAHQREQSVEVEDAESPDPMPSALERLMHELNNYNM